MDLSAKVYNNSIPHTLTPAEKVIAMTQKILVVEDEPHITEILDYRFKKESFNASFIGDGTHVLDETLKLLPSVILLDSLLPGKNGRAILLELKAHPDLKDIPVLVCSGRSDATEAASFIALGASDYITKPYDLDDLIAKIYQYIDQTAQNTISQNLNTAD